MDAKVLVGKSKISQRPQLPEVEKKINRKIIFNNVFKNGFYNIFNCAAPKHGEVDML